MFYDTHKDTRTCKYKHTCNHMQFFLVHLPACLSLCLFDLLPSFIVSVCLCLSHSDTHAHTYTQKAHHPSYLSLLSSHCIPNSLLTVFGIYFGHSLDSPCMCVCIHVCVCVICGMIHASSLLYGCHGDR